MANIKAISLLLVFSVIFMLASEVSARHYQYGNGSLKPYQCKGRCQYRCSDVTPHRIHVCMDFCMKCCRKCLCVPPGTYGYKWLCSCYNNWKTKRGSPKCP